MHLIEGMLFTRQLGSRDASVRYADGWPCICRRGVEAQWFSSKVTVGNGRNSEASLSLNYQIIAPFS